MQLRFRELLGKPVVAADGRQVGRVVDLIAEPRDDRLRVKALLVGPSALARRIGFGRATLLRVAPPRRIPWAAVASVGERVQLRAGSDELARRDDGAAALAAGETDAPAERRA